MTTYHIAALTAIILVLYGPDAILRLRRHWHNAEVAAMRRQIDRMARLIEQYEANAISDRRTLDKLANEVVGRDAMLATCREIIAGQHREQNELQQDLYNALADCDQLRANTMAGIVSRPVNQINTN